MYVIEDEKCRGYIRIKRAGNFLHDIITTHSEIHRKELDNSRNGRHNRTTNHEPRTTNHEPRTTNHEPRTTNHEPPRFVTKITDGEQVDLSLLSKEELIKLHYTEEKFVASELLKLPPFSRERSVLLNNGYSLVNAIMHWYNPSTAESNGASPKSVGLVSRFLASEKSPMTLYEAGTGAGFGVRNFLTLPHVSVKGCDVVLSDIVKDLMLEYPGRVSLEEATLYDSLKGIDDRSIDIFYADNVIEHMFPDEFPAIMELLSRKLKPGALLFLFIPNSVSGPRDISGKFLKMGHKAEGFHFMEMTCREVTEVFGKYGIVPAYFVFRTVFKNYRCIKDSSGILNRFKFALETASKFIPLFMRIKVMELLGLTSYILQKRA